MRRVHHGPVMVAGEPDSVPAAASPPLVPAMLLLLSPHLFLGEVRVGLSNKNKIKKGTNFWPI